MSVDLGRTQADVTSGNACWETPPAIFAKLHEEFNFDLDLFADADRALCRMWFGPGSAPSDALQVTWRSFGQTGFGNPPYGPFVPQALKVAHKWAGFGFTSVLLLPLRANKGFHQYVLRGAAELRFCDKRITFWENGFPRLNPKTGRPDPAPFDSIIVVYRPGIFTSPKVMSWHVPDHTGTPANTRTAYESPSALVSATDEALASRAPRPRRVREM